MTAARKWTRAEIAALSEDEFEKQRESIGEWLRAGAPEGGSADDPANLRLPENYKLTQKDVAEMSDAEFAANAQMIRDAVASGGLA